MKMKRIKLFEAFSNTDKIDKVNHLLFCWSVREFIKHKNLTPLLIDTPFGGEKFCLFEDSLSATNDKSHQVFYFCFYPEEEGDDINILCYLSLSDFLDGKKIYKHFFRGKANTKSLQKAVNHVVKKMYEDEKNKAV